jgi:hypothetical protein
VIRAGSQSAAAAAHSKWHPSFELKSTDSIYFSKNWSTQCPPRTGFVANTFGQEKHAFKSDTTFWRKHGFKEDSNRS